jgi:hypothetical protein
VERSSGGIVGRRALSPGVEERKPLRALSPEMHKRSKVGGDSYAQDGVYQLPSMKSLTTEGQLGVMMMGGEVLHPEEFSNKVYHSLNGTRQQWGLRAETPMKRAGKTPAAGRYHYKTNSMQVLYGWRAGNPVLDREKLATELQNPIQVAKLEKREYRLQGARSLERHHVDFKTASDVKQIIKNLINMKN